MGAALHWKWFVKESGDRDSPQDGRGQGDHSDEEDDYDYPQLVGPCGQKGLYIGSYIYMYTYGLFLHAVCTSTR